ncbi:hypothetical protein OVA24_19140 [Luteolibacter sp. SL250]|uniref:hypothetical protein n=1 Tax=Luteolibacter sp. SL250 TaxID=2995170 RepID=UPI0022711FB7|nr:hypothetical protein [Luteolibacter sp. SL250]WAC19346.1 hypothetical protein OVA24_19140 [Luteolibacter sp. SL250]
MSHQPFVLLVCLRTHCKNLKISMEAVVRLGIAMTLLLEPVGAQPAYDGETKVSVWTAKLEAAKDHDTLSTRIQAVGEFLTGLPDISFPDPDGSLFNTGFLARHELLMTQGKAVEHFSRAIREAREHAVEPRWDLKTGKPIGPKGAWEMDTARWKSFTVAIDVLGLLLDPSAVRELCSLLDGPQIYATPVEDDGNNGGFLFLRLEESAAEKVRRFPLMDPPCPRRMEHVFYLWAEWMKELRSGSRTLAFMGDTSGYRFMPDGTLEAFPRDPSHDNARWFLKGGDAVVNDPVSTGISLGRALRFDQIPRRVLERATSPLSLVVDDEDNRGRDVIIYLVNRTGEPVKGIVGGYDLITSEVWLRGRWQSREEIKGICGTGIRPRDLPAGHATAILGRSPVAGDIGGRIRYRLGKFLSEPQDGRYNLKQVEKMEARTLATIHGPWRHGGTVENNWSKGQAASNPEEFMAILELKRSLCGFAPADRLGFQRWLADRQRAPESTPEEISTYRRMEEVLARPSEPDGNLQTLLERCLGALGHEGRKAFGTPERCRVATWRYLFEVMNYQSHLPPTLRATFSPESIRRLGVQTKLALDSHDMAEREIAARMAAYTQAFDLGIPLDTFRAFLEQPQLAPHGLGGLSLRGQKQESIRWLVENVMRDDLDILACFRAASYGKRTDWTESEEKMMPHLFHRDPLGTIAILGLHRDRLPHHRFPPNCVEDLRTFLRTEISGKGRTRWKTDGPIIRPNEHQPIPAHRLATGLRFLVELGADEDLALLQSALDHPASYQSAARGYPVVFFPLRSEAKNLLRIGKLPVPEGIVTEIELKPSPGLEPPIPAVGYWTDRISGQIQGNTTPLRWTSGVLLASSICGWWFLRKSRRRSESPE